VNRFQGYFRNILTTFHCTTEAQFGEEPNFHASVAHISSPRLLQICVA